METGSETAPRLAGSIYLSLEIFVCKNPKIALDKLEILQNVLCRCLKSSQPSKMSRGISIQHIPSMPLLCGKKRTTHLKGKTDTRS